MGTVQKIDWPHMLLKACKRIERGEGDLSLTGLARGLGVGASELQRQFKRRLGVSPKTYAQALQLHRLTRRVSKDRSALDAGFAAGFESAASTYSNVRGSLGVPPGRLRNPLDIGWWLGLSDLGWMLMAATEKGICWLAFGDEPGTLREELLAAYPKAHFVNDERRLLGWLNAVREFVLLPQEALNLPLDVQGTAFQARVWRALREIPLGSTKSYSQVAREMGAPAAVRAVASACSHNRVALIIPCHRAVAFNGNLAGYRWGEQRKAELLKRERED